MSGYIVKNTPNSIDRFHVYRPGEDAPAFMLPTAEEAFDLIALDRAQPAPLIRCVGCVEEKCECLPQ